MSEHTSPVMAAVPGFGGNQAAAEAFRLLGETLGSAGAGIINDPAIRAAIEEMLNECETKTKEGGEQFFKENWPWFMLGGAGLIGGNFIMMFLLMGSMLNGRKVVKVKALRDHGLE